MVTVGKINEKPERKYASIAIMKDNECGIVSKVINTTTHDDIHIINIIVRKYREKEIGDKYCFNAAQKGTCGLLLSQEDMPFDENGLCPDLFINSLAFPNRMTLHQLISMATGTVAYYTGEIMDATPFETNDIIDTLVDKLDSLNLSKGKHVMYCGVTGRKLEATVFMGAYYYHRLKHLVSEKKSSRDQGKVDILTRQPVPGARSNNGGLRMSILQLDALATAGASSFIHEKISNFSDKFDVDVCSTCHRMCALERSDSKKPKVPISLCCKNISYNDNLPYATKIFF